jgi:ribosomal protein L20A (L18A)
MKLRSTLILFIVGAALAAYVYFVENKRPDTREAQQAAGRVAQVDRDKVSTIEIKNPEGKILLKKGESSEWSLFEPVKDRADSMAISQLFTSLETLRHDAKIEPEKKDQLKEFGLDDSATKIRLSEGDKTTEILLGKDTAVEGKVYVRVDGSDTVYVVGQDLKTQLNKKIDDFRDRKLADITPQQVTKVVVKTKDGEVVLDKKESHWRITKPLQARADDAKVNDLIAGATAARIDQFITDSSNLANYGLTEPRGTVEFYTEGSENPVTLQVGTNGKEEKDKEKTYAKLSSRDSVVLVPKDIEKILENKPNDLRDRNLVRVEADIVDRITVEVPGKPPIIMARKGETWVRKEGDQDVEINDAIAVRLLSELQTTQVANFVSDTAAELPKYGLDQPQMKLTLSSYASENTAETKAGDKPIVSLLIGKVEGDNGYAKLDDEPFVVAAPKTFIDQIPTDVIQLQPLTIYSFKPEEITQLEVTKQGQPLVSLERGADKAWKLAKGDGAVNQANVNAVANALANLRAIRWAGPTSAEHGLEKPAVLVSFAATQGDKTVPGKLTIGSGTTDSLFHATAEGKTGTFLLSKPDKDSFETQLIETPASTPPVPVGQTPAGQPAQAPAPVPGTTEAVTPPVQAPPNQDTAPAAAPVQPAQPDPAPEKPVEAAAAAPAPPPEPAPAKP